ncbi:MAG: Winged helix DNA-binding domain [Candidatus Parcubacteria bacterium]|jgi:DNA-binding MarR family transcriptional regulator
MSDPKNSANDGLALALMRLSRDVRCRIASAPPPPGCGTPLGNAVLWQVTVQGTPRLKELADALSVAPPTLTPIVAELVRAGHLTRTKDARDGRAARFALTASGKRAFERGKRRLIAAVERLLVPLTARDRKTILSIFTKLR